MVLLEHFKRDRLGLILVSLHEFFGVFNPGEQLWVQPAGFFKSFEIEVIQAIGDGVEGLLGGGLHLCVKLHFCGHHFPVHQEELLPERFVVVVPDPASPTQIEHPEIDFVLLGLVAVVNCVVVHDVVCKLERLRPLLFNYREKTQADKGLTEHAHHFLELRQKHPSGLRITELVVL